MRTKPRIEIDLDKVEEAAKISDNNEEIALALGISVSTLYGRKRELKEFEEAIKRGRAKANLFVGGKLMGLIKEGNVAATIFWLKTRCGWRETVKVESEANVKVQEKTASEIAAEMSTEELLAIARMKPDEESNA